MADDKLCAVVFDGRVIATDGFFKEVRQMTTLVRELCHKGAALSRADCEKLRNGLDYCSALPTSTVKFTTAEPVATHEGRTQEKEKRRREPLLP